MRETHTHTKKKDYEDGKSGKEEEKREGKKKW